MLFIRICNLNKYRGIAVCQQRNGLANTHTRTHAKMRNVFNAVISKIRCDKIEFYCMRAYVQANDSHMQYVCKSYKCTNKRIFKLRVAIANWMNGTKKNAKQSVSAMS